MAFAGLYSTWAGPNGEEVDTVCIVTVDPNLEISGVYDRMPAILRGRDAIEAWLNTREVDVAEARAGLAVSPPPGTMKYHPVSKAVGNANNGRPGTDPAADGGQAARKRHSARPKKKAANSGQLDLF